MVVFPTPAGPIVTIPYTMLALRRRAAGCCLVAAGAALAAVKWLLSLEAAPAAGAAGDASALAAVTYAVYIYVPLALRSPEGPRAACRGGALHIASVLQPLAKN